MYGQIQSKKQIKDKSYYDTISILIMLCSISIILTLFSCGTYHKHTQEMGGKLLDEVPADYWQHGLTLDVTIFIQRTDGVISLSINDDLLRLLESGMADTLTPPEGVEATYHAIPLYYIYSESGEDIEEFEADRYMEIYMQIYRTYDNKGDSVLVHAILYAPEKVPDYSELHKRRAEKQKIGLFRNTSGIVDTFRLSKTVAEYNRKLEKEQVGEGKYFSPVITEKANIPISKNETLTSKEQKAFMNLVGDVAEQMNHLVFSSN